MPLETPGRGTGRSGRRGGSPHALAVALALSASLAPGALVAQVASERTLDLGVVGIRQPGFADGSAVSLAGLWSLDADRWSVVSSGAVLRSTDDRVTGLALLAASHLAPPGSSRWEVGGTATVLGQSGTKPATGLTGLARQHWTGRLGGAWAGGSLGTLVRDGAPRGSAALDGGLWMQRDALRLGARVVSTWTRAEIERFTSDNGLDFENERFAYTDLSSSASWSARRVDVAGTFGLRMVTSGDLGRRSMGGVQATVWIHPHLAVAAAAGDDPADPTRGTAGARYGTVSLRVSAAPRWLPRATERGSVARPRLEASAAHDGSARLRVQAGSAQTAELMGDFTEWKPVAMARLGNSFELVLPMRPGPHKLLVRVNGGEWLAPPNLPTVEDEFGGKVGLVVVP